MSRLTILCITLYLVFTSSTLSAEIILPTKFENNLVIVTPVLSDGTKIRFFTDTGGGYNAISSQLFNKYQWPTIKKIADGREVSLSAMPNFKAGFSIPKGGINNFMEGYLFVVDKSELSKYGSYDGFLGGRWHAEKTIKYDYANETVSILSSLENVDLNAYTKVPLGFQKNRLGSYTNAFPRLEVFIDGVTHSMLLDTGATSGLNSQTQSLLKIESNIIATSFISSSIFDGWVEKHPEWKVILEAEFGTKESMIEVPKVSIAGHDVGPVWFTRRVDRNFKTYMSSMMDKEIEGAIGGSALKYFQFIVDYVGEQAFFSPFSD